MEKYLSIDELCERFPSTFKKSKIYNETMKKGEDSIPRIKFGKRLLFLESEVRNWMQKFREGMKPTERTVV